MLDLVQAWLDCRRSKRNSASALEFERNVERHLIQLRDELLSKTYQPGRSICFVVTRPKAREVWAAQFRDRIVHHLLYNHIAPRFERAFIANSSACIEKRGTVYAIERLERDVRSVTQNWSHAAHYLKCDLANFFVTIDKHVLRRRLHQRISEPFWWWLTETVLMHDPRTDYEFRGNPLLTRHVPPHKQLLNAPADTGLPIGNLSSQFFANVLLDALDQHVKHRLQQIGGRYYGRYVDDFYLLHPSPQSLNEALRNLTAWLPAHLRCEINRRKTILQPVDRGIDFVGQVIKPWRRTTRPNTRKRAADRLLQTPEQDLVVVANSYFGLLRQADHSHHDRARLARLLLDRGHVVDFAFTKIFKKTRSSHG